MTYDHSYRYMKGINPGLDAEFSSAVSYGKVKPGTTAIFWKSGLHWYCMPLNTVQRIFRRVEPVYGKLCCGGRSYFIEWLVLVLADGSEVVMHIGDDIRKEAESLLLALKEAHPEIAYGKV